MSRNSITNIKKIFDSYATCMAKEILWYCEKKNVILVYLKPYSPDLNDIELLWKIVKRKFRLIQWDQWKSLEQKIRNIMNNIWNQIYLLKNLLF